MGAKRAEREVERGRGAPLSSTRSACFARRFFSPYSPLRSLVPGYTFMGSGNQIWQAFSAVKRSARFLNPTLFQVKLRHHVPSPRSGFGFRIELEFRNAILRKDRKKKPNYRHLHYIPISKKGCFNDACFIDRSASCPLNLWLLFSSYYRTCSPKRRPNVFFYDLVFFWSAFSKKSDQFIYL